MSYANRLNKQLKDQDIDRFINRIPQTKTVRLKQGNHGSDSLREKRRSDGGQVNFYHYGGEVSRNTKFENLMSGVRLADSYEKGGKNYQTRKDWQKVAKELGIDNVDTEDKVRRMISHVRGAQQKNETTTAEAEPKVEYKPIGDIPRPGGQGREEQTDISMNPRLDKRFSGDPSKDAVSGGDDLNDWYNEKFIPHLAAEANYGSEQIGFDSNYLLDRFVNAPFETGSVGKLYEKYKGDIKKAAD